MEKKRSNHMLNCIICGLLSTFGFIAAIISLLSGSNGLWAVSDAVQLVLFILICFYAFAGYKKPHGNLLKIIILIYAAQSLVNLPSYVASGNIGQVLLETARTGLICYVAGRLVKIKENSILMILITALHVIEFILDATVGNVAIGAVNVFIPWIDICAAYFLRYKEHKEAGLEDAPKAK